MQRLTLLTFSLSIYVLSCGIKQSSDEAESYRTANRDGSVQSSQSDLSTNASVTDSAPNTPATSGSRDAMPGSTVDLSVPPEGTPREPVAGVWTSPEELARKPMSGPAWEGVKKFADELPENAKPNISDQDEFVNVHVLAAAIVAVRTGEKDFTVGPYGKKVLAALKAVIGTEVDKSTGTMGRTLAWGRKAGAYVAAADLLGYREAAFVKWAKDVADTFLCSQGDITLHQRFRTNPNNWGAMAFGSLAAIYSYLGDKTSLKEIRDFWVKAVEGPNPGYAYNDDNSWQADSNVSNMRLINPKGATKQGVNIDGIIADDMRRGAAFTTSAPTFTLYPSAHMQGILMGAWILERAGLPIWEAGDKALYRAAYALHVRLGGEWKMTSQYIAWHLPLLDHAYGTTWAQDGGPDVWGAGKNAGFVYVLPEIK